MDVNSDKRKRVLNALNGPRGHDFLRCFGDMSLREASKICMVGFATLCKQMKYWKTKAGHELENSGSHPSKCQDIKNFREKMLWDPEFRGVKDVLLMAARYIGRGNIVCAQNKPVTASKTPAAPQLKQNIPVLQPAPTPSPIQIHTPQDCRTWTLFTSLNQPRPLMSQQQAQMIGFARQAMQIVKSIPPPIKTTAPIPVLARQPVKVVLPEPPKKISAPKPEPKQKPTFRETETQVTYQITEETISDESLPRRSATPREINEPGAPTPCPPPHKPPRVSREIDVRPWMITAHCAFANVPKSLTSDQIQMFLNARYESLMTPRCLRCPLASSTCPYGMQSVLVPDPTLDALPDIEPIVDWCWLVTMGLAQ
jgi:hypothetical protein